MAIRAREPHQKVKLKVNLLVHRIGKDLLARE
jgi:hypothetical protein